MNNPSLDTGIRAIPIEATDDFGERIPFKGTVESVDFADAIVLQNPINDAEDVPNARASRHNQQTEVTAMAISYRDAHGLSAISEPPTPSVLQARWFQDSQEHHLICRRPRCGMCRILEDFLEQHRLFMAETDGALMVMDDLS